MRWTYTETNWATWGLKNEVDQWLVIIYSERDLFQLYIKQKIIHKEMNPYQKYFDSIIYEAGLRELVKVKKRFLTIQNKEII